MTASASPQPRNTQKGGTPQAPVWSEQTKPGPTGHHPQNTLSATFQENIPSTLLMPPLFFRLWYPKQVIQAMNKLKISNGFGLNEISSFFLKAGISILAGPLLSQLFKLAISSSHLYIYTVYIYIYIYIEREREREYMLIYFL